MPSREKRVWVMFMSRTEKGRPGRKVMHDGMRFLRNLAGRMTITSPLLVCIVSGVPA